MMHQADNAETAIAFHLSRLNRYAKYYIKAALNDSHLVNADDFGFLASVIEKKCISKSDLISYAVFEFSSGIEIIKRLLHNGLISEHVSPDDGRVKLLTPTEEGFHVFSQALEEMQKVATIVSATLNNGEKSQLLALLKRLDHFHEDIYHASAEYNLDSIIEKYVLREQL